MKVLITEGAGQWQAVDDPDLDSAAQLLGTAGMGERQRTKHRLDRRFNRLALSLNL